MEQHATLVMVEQLQAALVKLKKRSKYKLLDENYNNSFLLFMLTQEICIFKRARALSYFLYEY